MESKLKIFNIQIKNDFKECLEFKQILSNKISIIKQKDKNENYSNINIDDKNLTISFIFFSYLNQNFFNKKLIQENNNNNVDKDYILLNYPQIVIKDFKYKIFYYFQHYLIISFIKEIQSLLKENGTNCMKPNAIIINKLNYIFEKNNDVIIFLYKNEKLKINDVLSLLDIYFLWIEENKDIDNKIKENFAFDNYHKIKNYFLYKYCFNLLENLFLIELNKNKNKQKEDLNELFKYLDKISKDNIYSFNNKITILKNKSFTNLFKTIFDNISINIYNKYQTILIQFFKDFIKFNGLNIEHTILIMPILLDEENALNNMGNIYMIIHDYICQFKDLELE
jgi:hypothetical protein